MINIKFGMENASNFSSICFIRFEYFNSLCVDITRFKINCIMASSLPVSVCFLKASSLCLTLRMKLAGNFSS
ncbi:hypothetical protein T10_4241 [Trichinella papuae]|uniref:Uncharacterized protein n=1 Tax=Trichinella papuae TaxID=268474 RepID=A0A0V1N358_9BILA|nr:hypothetical protein T10_4241 [Trichinella papuae]